MTRHLLRLLNQTIGNIGVNVWTNFHLNYDRGFHFLPNAAATRDSQKQRCIIFDFGRILLPPKVHRQRSQLQSNQATQQNVNVEDFQQGRLSVCKDRHHASLASKGPSIVSEQKCQGYGKNKKEEMTLTPRMSSFLP